MYLRLYSRRYIQEYSLKMSGLGKFQFKIYNAGASIAFFNVGASYSKREWTQRRN